MSTESNEVTATEKKVQIDSSKYDYGVHKEFRTTSGRSAVDNGDKVAEALRGMPLEMVKDTLILNGGTVNPAWDALNMGMQRMAAGNALRRIQRKLETEGKELKISDEAISNVRKVNLKDIEAKRDEAKAKRDQETAMKKGAAQEARLKAREDVEAKKIAAKEAKIRVSEETAAKKLAAKEEKAAVKAAKDEAAVKAAKDEATVAAAAKVAKEATTLDGITEKPKRERKLKADKAE